MTSNNRNQNFFAEFSQYFLAVLTAVGTLLLLGWLLRYSVYGIDFTDEGFYLVWISNPFIYSASTTQFGFIYHPLYRLLGGDIATLRQANILLTFGLAWGLTYNFLASLAPELKDSRYIMLTAAAGLATSTFTLFDSWLPTPSYNSLALQSLLISACGLILAEKTGHRRSIIGWLLIGFGGWLAFMAKPSTAVALAVGVLFFLLFSRKFSIRLFFLAGASALILLLASGLLIDGSILRFVERIQLGMEISKHLDGGYTLTRILRIDGFQLGKMVKLAILLVFITLFISLWSMWAKSRKWVFVGVLISIAFFALSALLTRGQIPQAANFGQFRGFLIFGLVFAATFAGLVLGRVRALATITAPQWAIACLFLTMPHIYAFGTNGNYWQVGSGAAIFWLLSGLTLLGPLLRERASWLLTLPLALAAQAVTATLLQTGLEDPYRQTQPLRLNASVLEIGPQRAPLILSEGYAEYIASAVAVAQEAGFEPSTPVIDLSGQSPGILYALGAENVGQPWTIGGYPGSLSRAVAALDFADCKKIASAWVLSEPDGPRSISTELLLTQGISFPNDYQIMGSWFSAEGAGGYSKKREQFFYAPLNYQQNIEACRSKRYK